MFQKIVVGTDGFGRASAAVERAVALASASGGEVIVVHSYPDPGSPYGLAREQGGGVTAAEGVLVTVEKNYAERARLRTVLRRGEPADALLAVSDEEAADLLVVGNLGMSKRFSLGSVPNQVSHHAKCDVLIANTEQPSRGSGQGPIVAGVDGSDTSLQALAVAARLAALRDVDLVGLYVHWRQEDDTAASVLDGASSSLSDSGARFRARTESGDPADLVIRVAEEEGADTIVLGNKGMSGVKRFTLGNVPNKVSHHAPCDLLIVRTT
ncbi:MAG: universal stress protein [Actinomycetota bacterium]|nr:universal stress protein [Actinomycetota bacterium]